MQKLKERINITNVDTNPDRNDEFEDEKNDCDPIQELSPFININRTSLPYGGLSKPNVPSPNHLNVGNNDSLFDKTTGESPFSSPRNPGESEEIPELVEIKEEKKTNMVVFVKAALDLANIGTLEESFIEPDPIDQLAIEQQDTVPARIAKRLELEKVFEEYKFKDL